MLQHDPESDFTVQNALLVICGLEAKQDDPFPKQVCTNCFSVLEQAYNLRQQSQRSHEMLVTLLAEADGQQGAVEYEVEYLDQEQLDVECEPVKREESLVFVSELSVEVDETVEHRCCGCDASYSTELELKRHAARKHRPKGSAGDSLIGKIACNVCYGVFSRKELRSHRIGKNNVQQWEKCEFCGCNFASTRGLAKHRNQFHQDKLYRCCGCDFSSLKRDELLSHSSSHEETVVEANKRFACRLCHARFDSISDKRFHERYPYRVKREQNDQTDGPAVIEVFRCCGCPKIYPTLEELRAHRQTIHLPQKNTSSNEDSQMLAECGGCYKLFRNNSALNRHLRKATDKKLYACSKCSVTRRTLQELLEHEASHSGGVAFLCCGCRKGFDSRESLETHSREVHANRPKVYHNDGEDTTRPFECNVCYRRYKTAKDLRGHQRYVYYEKVHSCQVCGKGFAQEHSLAIHQATHNTHAEFPCQICGKHYKHEAKARNCVVRHERPRQHRCKICDVTFPAASNLYSHMISHSDDRRHKCNTCGQSFKRSFHLRKHQKMHTSERNHSCRFCPSRFTSTTELYKHEIRHTGQYPYQCSICQKQLTTRQNFIKHYEAHMDDSAKVFGCQLCSERFSEEHFLSNHIKYKHRIEPQDKSWNEKFNRQGPNRARGGTRVAGVEGRIGSNNEMVSFDQGKFVIEEIVEEMEFDDE